MEKNVAIKNGTIRPRGDGDKKRLEPIRIVKYMLDFHSIRAEN